MLNCTRILEIVPSPHRVTTVKLDNSPKNVENPIIWNSKNVESLIMLEVQ